MIRIALLLLSNLTFASERIIEYTVTSKMWDEAGQVVDTTPQIRKRIATAFEFWQRASGEVLGFRESLSNRASYDSRAQIPYDGRIHVVLNGRYKPHGELGNASFRGTIPDELKRASIFMVNDIQAQRYSVFVHEIGHVLGMHHAATNTSMMFRGRRLNNRELSVEATSQDTANLVDLWAPHRSFSIEGSISTAHDHRIVMVCAVNEMTGLTFSTRSDHMGVFRLPVSQPGRYFLVAKALEESDDIPALAGLRLVPQRASWYVAESKSAETPAEATILQLSETRRHITNIRLAMIDRYAIFPLTRAETPDVEKLVRLKPGDEIGISFPFLGDLAEVDSFGADPDYWFRKTGARREFVLTIAADALPGERLVVARDHEGREHIGLVGIHIIKGEK